MRPLRNDAVFLALLGGAAVLILHLSRTVTIPYGVSWVMLDEGYRVYPSLRLLDGESLFGGMFTPYPPFSYYLHLFAYETLGIRMSTIRVLLGVSQLATTLLTYILARRIMSRWFALYAALVSLVYGVFQLAMGYSGWYAMPWTLAVALFLCRAVERESAPFFDLALAGICAGVAFGIKHRDGALVAVAAGLAILLVRVLRDFEPGRGRPAAFHPLYAAHLLLPILILALVHEHLTVHRLVVFVAPCVTLSGLLLARQLLGSARLRPRVGRLIAELSVFGAGLAAVNLPWIAYYCWSAGPGPVWRQLVTIPLGMQEHMVQWVIPEGLAASYGLAAAALALAGLGLYGRGRGLARALPWVVAAALLALPALVRERNSLLEAGRFVLLPCVSVLGLLYLTARWRALELRHLEIAVLVVFNCLLTFSLYPLTERIHGLWASSVAVILASFFAWGLAGYLSRHASWLRVSVYVVQIALLLLMLPAELDPQAERKAPVRLRGAPRADVPMDPLSAGAIQPVVDFINAEVPPGDYILEIPSSFFAFLTGRRQAAQLDYFHTLDAKIWDEPGELEHIRQRNPLYAIIPRRNESWLHWRESFPGISSYLNLEYEPIKRVGETLILRRRTPAPRRDRRGG